MKTLNYWRLTVKHNKLISLYINSSELTPEQINAIMHFCTRFWRENPEEIEILCDRFPMRINGKLSELTSLAKDYFKYWNKKGLFRNLSVVKKDKI